MYIVVNMQKSLMLQAEHTSPNIWCAGIMLHTGPYELRSNIIDGEIKQNCHVDDGRISRLPNRISLGYLIEYTVAPCVLTVHPCQKLNDTELGLSPQKE